MNEVYLIGNAGRDAEIKVTTSGKEMARFSIATVRGPKENQKTTWHNIVGFGYSAQRAAKIKKGDRIFVNGSIEISEGKEGKKFCNIIARQIQIISKDNANRQDFDQVDQSEEIPF